MTVAYVLGYKICTRYSSPLQPRVYGVAVKCELWTLLVWLCKIWYLPDPFAISIGLRGCNLYCPCTTTHLRNVRAALSSLTQMRRT